MLGGVRSGKAGAMVVLTAKYPVPDRGKGVVTKRGGDGDEAANDVNAVAAVEVSSSVWDAAWTQWVELCRLVAVL